jgi:hypothetical protein
MSLNRTPVGLPDFTRFHGMLCGPAASQRCIDAFDGRTLFMPHDYKQKGIAAYEVIGSGMSGLNIFTYYSLVLSSLTGLSTLLGATTTITSEEDLGGITDPTVTPDIKDYLHPGHPSPHTLIIRRFEYHFMLPDIRVKMWHLLGEDGKLSLLEIYQSLDHLDRIYACAAGAAGVAAAGVCAYVFGLKA